MLSRVLRAVLELDEKHAVTGDKLPAASALGRASSRGTDAQG